MISIKTAFGRAATGKPRVSTFWLLVFAIAILDDAQDREKRREEEQRKKRDAKPPRKPNRPSGPRPL